MDNNRRSSRKKNPWDDFKPIPRDTGTDSRFGSIFPVVFLVSIPAAFFGVIAVFAPYLRTERRVLGGPLREFASNDNNAAAWIRFAVGAFIGAILAVPFIRKSLSSKNGED